MAKRKILVTGGAGFVGASLVRKLLENRRNEVGVITRKGGSTDRLHGVLNNLQLFKGVLETKGRIVRLLKEFKPSTIFHLATYGSYPNQKNIKSMVDVNVVATLNLLDASKTAGCKHVIIAGSSSEYGKKAKPMKESDLLEPNNFYAATKAAGTHLAQVFAQRFDQPVSVLRLFNIYGPFEQKGRLVRSVIESALDKRPILLATGKEARDFIFMDDVVDAFIHTMYQKPGKGEVFNIGTGKQTTILQLAKKVKEIVDSSVKIKLNEYPGRPWDTHHWVADMTKTRRVLNWKPRYTLDKGLEKTIEWYKKNRSKK